MVNKPHFISYLLEASLRKKRLACLPITNAATICDCNNPEMNSDNLKFRI